MAEYKGASSEGQRQVMLEKRREQMMRDFEQQREKIQKDSDVKIGKDRFIVEDNSIEHSLKASTVGLMQLEDFQRVREQLQQEKEREAARTNELKDEKKKRKKKREKMVVSFDMDDEDAVEATKEKKKRKKARFGMNPAVNTSFLPDREREADERRVREELRQEWLQAQEEMKSEPVKITYSYWDGSGHRKEVVCKKGDSISTFLARCREQVHDLRGVGVDNMMYIKEDLIIPHHYTFYDFIVNKARGKSGPLFNFDVQDDVRLVNDASVETEESHAGKVVERSWYEKNKHIFPASRWEVYDPEKDYGRYTIKDTNKAT
ncbi:FAM50A protein [Thamnocephalis sphaerospora]|uniref:FAM50A protein n=1 Tax=Thamnocephalis sphaerospora TaxID=78915 RepID=A0A4V1IW34_9FUNG|nr:FAM50A protein [Thamnocephalis sphaerospora]|eukprot:RKP06169.1 FAM50A protein [Thamnocephalis sphaerospora]